MKMKTKPTASEYLLLLTSQDTAAVADSLAATIKAELNYARSSSCSYGYGGYIDQSDPSMITADERAKVVDWCYALVDHCRCSRETVATAMELVDRFLSKSKSSNSVDTSRMSGEALRDQCKFQLLTVTALYTSIKINEEVPVSSDLFSKMCRNTYSAEEIEDMERTLLSGLSWRCQAPTAHQIVLYIFSLLLPYVGNIPQVVWAFLMDEVKYMTELAVRDYYFSTQRASTIALAAILNVVHDTTVRLEKLLKPFLRLIMESFDFDRPMKIAAARKRLKYLTITIDPTPDFLDEVVDECNLDISVKTLKVSNRSSQKKKTCFEFEVNEHEMSPSCYLSLSLQQQRNQDHDLSSIDQDLQDLFSGDQDYFC